MIYSRSLIVSIHTIFKVSSEISLNLINVTNFHSLANINTFLMHNYRYDKEKKVNASVMGSISN